MNNRLGMRLKAARTAVHATQYEWGPLAGVDQSTYSRWEAGLTMPDLLPFLELCAKARLCPSCLVFGPEHKRGRHLLREHND